MKKLIIGILILIMAFLTLCVIGVSNGLTDAPAASAPTAEPTAAAETAASAIWAALSWDLRGHMELYREILLEGREFYSAAAGDNISLRGLGRAVNTDGRALVDILSFALVDMDGDALPELLLRLKVNNDEYYGYELLRRESEHCYGYTIWYRAMTELKNDGSFTSGMGALCGGFGRMSFEGSKFTYVPEIRSDSVPAAGGSFEAEYYIGGRKTDAETFKSALAAQSEKDAPQWFDYTGESVRDIFE